MKHISKLAIIFLLLFIALGAIYALMVTGFNLLCLIAKVVQSAYLHLTSKLNRKIVRNMASLRNHL